MDANRAMVQAGGLQGGTKLHGLILDVVGEIFGWPERGSRAAAWPSARGLARIA